MSSIFGYNPNKTASSFFDLEAIEKEKQEKAEKEKLKYQRKVFNNPTYKMTKDEAITYAIDMGATDSFRGIGQALAKGFNLEKLDDKLKKDYDTFQTIINNEEYGSDAFKAFLGSAIALDPVSYAPIAGWISKGKKAKNLLEFSKYGAKSGAVVSALGYTAEGNEGIFTDKDASFVEKKMEQVGIGGGAGAVLSSLGGGITDAVVKARTGKSIFDTKNILKKELTKEEQLKYIDPIDETYNKLIGKPLLSAAQKSPLETTAVLFGGVAGYQYGEDPELTTKQKMFQATLGASAAYATLKGGKKLDNLFFEGQAGLTLNRAFIPDYNIPQSHIKRRDDFVREKNTIMMEFGDIANEMLKTLSKNERTVLYQFMSGEINNPAKMNSLLYNLNNKSRDKITTYANELVQRGLLNEKVFKTNVDNYVRRSYLKHKMVGADGTTSKLFDSNRKINLIATELMPRGIEDSTTFAQFNKANSNWKKEGWFILDKTDEEITKLKPNQSIKVRRDLTKAERKELGEIEDAAHAMLEMGRVFGNDVAAIKYFDSIAEDATITLTKKQYEKLSDLEKRNYQFIPETNVKNVKLKRYGKLAGNYLQTDVARDVKHTFNLNKTLNDINEETGGVALLKRGAEKAQTIWKKLKTVYNPGTHVGNVISNFTLLDMSAKVPVKYVGKAIAEMFKGKEKSSIYKQAVIDGVGDMSLVSKDLGEQAASVIEKELLDLAKAQGYVETGAWNYVINMANKIPDKINPVKFMPKLYQAEDTVFRLATYMHRIDTGQGRAKATFDARKHFVDYNVNADAVSWMRKYTHPFITYAYRAVPLMYQASIKNPVSKLGKWSGIIYASSQLGKKIAGDDGEINEATMREDKNRNMYGVPILPKTNIRLPFNDEDGDPLYLDIQRWLPGGDIFEQRSEASPGVPFLPAIVQPGGLYVDAILTMGAKKDPFTGKDLSDLSDTERFIYFGKRLGPNIPGLPGTFATEKIKRSKRDELGMTESGQPTMKSPYVPTSTPMVHILAGLGIRVNPQNEDINIKSKEYEIQLKQRKSQDKINKANRDLFNQRISEDQHQKILDVEYEKLGWWTAEQEALMITIQDIKAKRLNKFEGGEVDVPYTKDEPEDRVDPFTGQPYSDQMARLGLAEGGKPSLAELVLNAIQKDPKRNYSNEEISVLKRHADYVANAESDNIANRIQMGGGPGRGKYQYELSTENKSGQQGAKTAVNRYINFKKDKKLTLTEKDKQLMQDKNPDFSKLSEDMQDAIFYADKAMGKMPVTDLVKGNLSQEDAWADYHWSGNPEERQTKIDYFIGKNYMPKEITRGKLEASPDYQ